MATAGGQPAADFSPALPRFYTESTSALATGILGGESSGPDGLLRSLRGRDVNDAVIVSDLHLGSHNCQARQLCQFLEDLHEERLRTERLILNGNVFDSLDLRRLNKHHGKVLSLFRKLSDRLEIIWLGGNHDGPAEFVSHLLGVTVMDEFILHSGDERILILHGHV